MRRVPCCAHHSTASLVPLMWSSMPHVLVSPRLVGQHAPPPGSACYNNFMVWWMALGELAVNQHARRQ
jgi:hypothetical protein